MPGYYRRSYRRFNNFVGAVRRNPIATRVQHAFGITDRSTGRQLNRLGAYTQKRLGQLNASDIGGRGDYYFKTPMPRGKYGAGSGFVTAKYAGSMKDYSGRRRTATKPKVQKLEKGEMCIQHSEYIGDLISAATSGNFSSQNYAINPGNSSTFPWLSAVAINFQDYRFKKLVFEYRPLVSESTSTSTGNLLSMGAVILATQYDSVTGPYINKNTMENSEYAVSKKPSEHLLHAIECNPRFNPLGVLYVSGGQGISNSNVTNSDIRMQNLGIFQAASQGVPGSSIDCGEIWVHYEVELYKPQLNAGLTNLLSGHWINNAQTGAATTITPFGPNVNPTAAIPIQPTAQPGTLLQCTFTNVAGPTNYGTVVTFPLGVTEGSFLVMYYCTGTAANVVYGGWVATQGCNLLAVFNADSNGDYFAPSSGTAGINKLVIGCMVSVNAPGSTLAQITLNMTSSGVTPTAGNYDLIITPFNTNIVT